MLIASYAVQLGVIRYAALNQPGMPDWRLTMPIPVIDDRGLPTSNGDIVTAIMLVLAALQSYALLALYRAHAFPGRCCGPGAACCSHSRSSRPH